MINIVPKLEDVTMAKCAQCKVALAAVEADPTAPEERFCPPCAGEIARRDSYWRESIGLREPKPEPKPRRRYFRSVEALRSSRDMAYQSAPNLLAHVKAIEVLYGLEYVSGRGYVNKETAQKTVVERRSRDIPNVPFKVFYDLKTKRHRIAAGNRVAQMPDEVA